MKKFFCVISLNITTAVMVITALSLFTLVSCKKEPVLTLTKDYFRVKSENGSISRYYILRPTSYVYDYEDESVTLSSAKVIFDNDLKQYDDMDDVEVISFDKTDDYYEIKWSDGVEITTEQYSDIYDTSLEEILTDKDPKYYFVDKNGVATVWETAKEVMHKDIMVDGLQYNCKLLGYYDLRVAFSKYDKQKNEQWIRFYQSLNFVGSNGVLRGWTTNGDYYGYEDEYDEFDYEPYEVLFEERRTNDNDDVNLMYEDYNSRIGEMSFIKGYDNQIQELLKASFIDGFLTISYRCWKYDREPTSVVEQETKDSKQNTSQTMDKKKLQSIYEKTIKYWQYDDDAYFFKYSAGERLNSGRGICWDYALYFYNECKKQGIKDVHFVVSNSLKHAWNEVWDGDDVYIIDTTFGDTDPHASINKYFMVDASTDKEHYENDICVVDDTLIDNDISSLYRGVVFQDAKRQRYTSARPIVKLSRGK